VQDPSLTVPEDLIPRSVLTAPLWATVDFAVQVPLHVIHATPSRCASNFDYGRHFSRQWNIDLRFCLLADNTNFFAATTIAPLSIGLHNSSLLEIALPAVHFILSRVIEVPLGAVIPRPIANLVSVGSDPGQVTALLLHHLVDLVIVFLIMDACDMATLALAVLG
jgi:hypothetical protein